MRKLLILVVLVGPSIRLAGCGRFERWFAGVTGYSRICVGSVSYLQSTSGAGVKYTRDGCIKIC